MSILKRAASVAMVLTLAAGLNVMPVLAAETAPENGDYTATIHFHNASNPANYSMCDSIFAHTADVTLTDENAKLTFYVAYPIPAFSDQGAYASHGHSIVAKGAGAFPQLYPCENVK